MPRIDPMRHHRNPQKYFLRASVLYEVVTPESAASSDYAEQGYERPPTDVTLREAIELLKEWGPIDSYEFNGDRTPLIFRGTQENIGYYDGSVTRYTVVISGDERLLDIIEKWFYANGGR